MDQAITIGLDLAKQVFQAHGADAAGRVLFRKRLSRSKLLAFFAGQPPCTVAMEACAGAHHWGREIARLGHAVRLIPPAYVKPFVKRQKNDAADAEAICEAAGRPTMRFVPVKSEESQASGVLFRARDLLVGQRTQCINALRGHLAEYGHIFPKGITQADQVMASIESPDTRLPEAARTVLKVLVSTFRTLTIQIKDLDAEIGRRAKADPVARRLMTIPGIGPIAATAITALVPAAESFKCGRDFAAWLGLTPLQRSTGGKQKLGVDPPLVSRTPLIRSERARMVFDGEDETRVHARVQARGGRAFGGERPAADADRGRTRDPALHVETMAHERERDCLTSASGRIATNRANEPCRVPIRSGGRDCPPPS